MNKFFRKLSLPAKLMLMALVPLALLIYFIIQIYKEKSEKVSMLDGYLARINQSVVISNLIDALQSERRYSFAVVINGDRKTELLLQRPKSDSAIRDLSELESLKDVRKYTFLDTIQRVRLAIDNMAYTPEQVMTYYTNVLFRLNTLNSVTASNHTFLANL